MLIRSRPKPDFALFTGPSSKRIQRGSRRGNLQIQKYSGYSACEGGHEVPIHNPKTLLRLEDLNFGEARANPNEP